MKEIISTFGGVATDIIPQKLNKALSPYQRNVIINELGALTGIKSRKLYDNSAKDYQITGITTFTTKEGILVLVVSDSNGVVWAKKLRVGDWSIAGNGGNVFVPAFNEITKTGSNVIKNRIEAKFFGSDNTSQYYKKVSDLHNEDTINQATGDFQWKIACTLPTKTGADNVWQFLGYYNSDDITKNILALGLMYDGTNYNYKAYTINSTGTVSESAGTFSSGSYIIYFEIDYTASIFTLKVEPFQYVSNTKSTTLDSGGKSAVLSATGGQTASFDRFGFLGIDTTGTLTHYNYSEMCNLELKLGKFAGAKTELVPINLM